MSLQAKIDYSIALMRKAESLALSMHPDGFRLAFSGGKDSIVMHRLAEMAGVKFKAHMQITTLDPPELMHYVRSHYPDVELHRPEINFYNLIKKKKMLPLRQVRYCCACLKEQAGAGTVTMVGVRRQESVRRSKRNEVEISGYKYSNSFDQFNIENERQHVCLKGKDKLLVLPILYWTHDDIWTFIHENNMPYCELYDKGYTRIGCMFCPMAKTQAKQLDRLRYPGVERTIKKSIQFIIDNNNNFSEKYKKYSAFNEYNATADEIFDWWVSNRGFREYFENLRRQTKIEFK
jgi:phosphoadenosine phosphosulfate reductase